jgi:hypothetical protein
MTDDDRRRAAQAILEFPLFNALWDEMEQAAITATINAQYNDHETRQAHAVEARVIRRIRQKLKDLSKEVDASSTRRVPA